MNFDKQTYQGSIVGNREKPQGLETLGVFLVFMVTYTLDGFRLPCLSPIHPFAYVICKDSRKNGLHKRIKIHRFHLLPVPSGRGQHEYDNGKCKTCQFLLIFGFTYDIIC